MLARLPVGPLAHPPAAHAPRCPQIVAFGLLMGVLAVILFEIGLSLGWVYLFMGIAIGAAAAGGSFGGSDVMFHYSARRRRAVSPARLRAALPPAAPLLTLLPASSPPPAGGAVAPIYMALVWSKASATGAITGAISGLLLGIAAWLITCQAYYGSITIDLLVRALCQAVPGCAWLVLHTTALLRLPRGQRCPPPAFSAC